MQRYEETSHRSEVMEEIINHIKNDDITVAHVAKDHDVSEATIYTPVVMRPFARL